MNKPITDPDIKTDMPDWFKTFSFSMPADTKAAEFFRTMEDQNVQFHTIIEKRVEQLFNQFIQVDEKVDEKVRTLLSNIFAYGYTNGWNDYKHIIDKEKNKES